MRRRLTAFFPICLCVAFAGGCATTHDTDELKAIFDQGVIDYDAGRYDEAFRIFKSIDGEDVAAMRNEGLMLRKGLGTAKDPRAAEDILERAAEAGLPTAQYDLAEMYLNGEVGDPDPEAALPWLKRAAASHHPMAEFRLGQMLEEGKLLDKDIKAARAFYGEAAAAGVPGAKERLAALGNPVPGAQPPLMPAVKP